MSSPNRHSRKTPFPSEAPRAEKVGRGRTDAEHTPLAIRTSGVDLPDALDAYVRTKLASRLGKFARHIERITVRFEDFNGPKGGVDTECRIQVFLPSLPSELAKVRAASPRIAFDACGHTIVRNVQKTLERHGFSIGHRARRTRGERSATGLSASEPNPPPAEGSLIDRRVGQGRANLARAAARPEKARRDAYVDTAAPGTSATDRKAGGGSTARRNTKLRQPETAAALEDSARETPSRKSTRKSGNRLKAATPLTSRARMTRLSPQSRAEAASAKGPKGGAGAKRAKGGKGAGPR